MFNRRLMGAGLMAGGLMVAVVLPTAAETNPAVPPVSGTEVRDPTKTVALKYLAYVAGIPSGEARMVLERRGLPARGSSSFSYNVAGTARSKGLWESIQKWRAEYSVNGEVHQQVRDGGNRRLVLPGHFYSLQTTPKKRREIHIEDGVLRETKNNKVRDPRPSQTGFDLLSALFFLPACHPAVRVHTGRDGYEMRRIEPPKTAEPGAETKLVTRCRYQVTDDEGDNYQMMLVYGQRGDFIVPTEITAKGPVSGRMVLAEE